MKPMAYSTPYDYNTDTIYTLDEKFREVTDDRFLYCIQEQQKWNIEKANLFKARLHTSQQYTLMEIDRLNELDKTFNKEFPSDHRKYVNSVQEIVSKMRCTLSGLKKVISEFRDKGKTKKNVTLMDDSALFTGPYMKNVFGWDSYSDNSAQELLDELNAFLKDADTCINLAVKMLQDEAAIINDPEQAFPIYIHDYQHSVSGNRTMIKMIESQRPDLENDFVKALDEAEDVKKLIASLFHAFNRDIFNYNSACWAIHEGRKADLTTEESLIWGRENERKVKRLRILLDHILELPNQMENVIKWKGMLSGYFVMRLLKWCGWDGTKNTAMLDYITKRCSGVIGVVKMGAVIAEKLKYAHKDYNVDANEQQAFNKEIDTFIDNLIAKANSSAS